MSLFKLAHPLAPNGYLWHSIGCTAWKWSDARWRKVRSSPKSSQSLSDATERVRYSRPDAPLRQVLTIARYATSSRTRRSASGRSLHRASGHEQKLHREVWGMAWRVRSDANGRSLVSSHSCLSFSRWVQIPDASGPNSRRVRSQLRHLSEPGTPDASGPYLGRVWSPFDQHVSTLSQHPCERSLFGFGNWVTT
jgi:hypothetical protein